MQWRDIYLIFDNLRGPHLLGSLIHVVGLDTVYCSPLASSSSQRRSVDGGVATTNGGRFLLAGDRNCKVLERASRLLFARKDSDFGLRGGVDFALAEVRLPAAPSLRKVAAQVGVVALPAC